MRNKTCLVCKVKNSFPICVDCTNDPFKIEKCRQVLAENGDLASLKKLYVKGFPTIKDLNTQKFWDQKIDRIFLLKDEDYMAKKRIKTVLEFTPNKPIRILDIGVGYGFLEESLSKRNDVEIFANDISPNAIEILKKRFKGNFKVEVVQKMSYPKKHFDVIYALELFEHIIPSETLLMLEKLNSFLVDDGVLIISVPTNERLQEKASNESGHVREYTVDLLKAELLMTGFNPKRLETISAFGKYAVIKDMISEVIKNHWEPNNIVVLARKV